MSVIIRTATKSDRPAIRKLIQQYPGALMQDDLPDTDEFFVAVEDKKVIGCCALAVYRLWLAEIRSLAVHQEYQHRGIGKRLIRSCIAEARRLRIRRLMSVTGALQLFGRFGLKPFQGEKFALFRRLR